MASPVAWGAEGKSRTSANGSGARTVPFALPASSQVPGKKYVRAVADVEGRVSESNEQNNLWNAQSSCLY